MKITLTVDEAKAICEKHFSNILCVKTEVSIEVMGGLQTNPHWIIYQQLVKPYLATDKNFDKKITFIKALRAAVNGMGLADAKYCVESELNTVNQVLLKFGTLVGYSENMKRL